MREAIGGGGPVDDSRERLGASARDGGCDVVHVRKLRAFCSASSRGQPREWGVGDETK